MKVRREEAHRFIHSTINHVVSWEVLRLENAIGRVLSEDIVSPVNVPAVNRSAVDGYAVRASETPGKFKVIGEVPAGIVPQFKVGKGETALVMTGGVVPEGADAVVRVEDVKVKGDEVIVEKEVREGELINFAGSEIKKGTVILRAGRVIDAISAGILASVGVWKVRVYRKPRVAIIVSGSEIVEPEEKARPVDVFNSNYFILNAILESVKVSKRYFGIVKDNKDEIVSALNYAFTECDVVITCGGISKGKYDLVKSSLEDLGVNIFFTETNIKPGRPLVFGKRDKTVFFGLPGYPFALFVNAVEFLIPALKHLAGNRNWQNRYFPVKLASPLKGKKGRVDFVRAKVVEENGELVGYPIENQLTSAFYPLVNSNALLILGEDKESASEGEVVKALIFQ